MQAEKATLNQALAKANEARDAACSRAESLTSEVKRQASLLGELQDTAAETDALRRKMHNTIQVRWPADWRGAQPRAHL